MSLNLARYFAQAVVASTAPARAADLRRAGVKSARDYVVAGMPTMPTRKKTFGEALASIIRQVDRLYLYLDGHSEVPEQARGDERIIPILSRDVPGLHGNGKYLGLVLEDRDCLYIGVDDDIHYNFNYVNHLRNALSAYNDRAVVGLHCSIIARPLERYTKNRTKFRMSDSLSEAREVDTIGTGTSMFHTKSLQFDVRKWPFTNMADLGLALEAARKNLPMICIARPKNLVRQISVTQDDSVFGRLIKDDSRQTALAHELLRIRAQAPEPSQPSSI